MAHKYNISVDGLEFIKAYEGFRPVETVLASGQKVIGYGHPYIRGEASLLTHKKAEEILKSDLEPIETIINHIVFAPISQNQFDALVSLAFNIGIDDFADSSVLHYLNNGQPLAAAAGFDEWRKSIIADQAYVIDALVRRRTAEKALFLSPESGVIAAPRYELPVLHDSTVSIDESDIGIFGVTAADSFVVQAPYENEPVQERRSEDGPAGGLMMSERTAAPQIYEDVMDVNIVSETDNEVNTDAEGDSGDYSIEDVVINNVVEMRPELESEPESGTEIVVEAEPPQDEGLSPIALAAADVSERLESLMEKTAIEAEVVTPVDESVTPENFALNAVNEDELTQAAITIVEPVIFEPKIVETELSEPETTETEAEITPESETKPEQSALDVTPNETPTGAGAFWTTLVIGLFLIGASLWQMKFSPITNLGEMGEFLVPVVLLVGAMMIMGGMFYMLKAQLRDT